MVDIPRDHRIELSSLLQRSSMILQSYQVPVCRFGYFGSAVHDPDTKDIDVLLTLSLSRKDISDFKNVLATVVARMDGDYTSKAPVNLASMPYIEQCVSALHEATGLPVVFGLGPSNKHNHLGQWIHLNGPMTDELWSLFTRRYPIHGFLIHENYVPIVGNCPDASPFDGETLLEYCADMVRRDRAMPTLKTADKFIRVLALLGGESHVHRASAIDKVFSWAPILAEELKSFFSTAKDSEASQMTLALSDAVSSMAKIMIARNMKYPQNWRVS